MKRIRLSATISEHARRIALASSRSTRSAPPCHSCRTATNKHASIRRSYITAPNVGAHHPRCSTSILMHQRSFATSSPEEQKEEHMEQDGTKDEEDDEFANLPKLRTFASENPDLVERNSKGLAPNEKFFFEDFDEGEEIPIVPLPPFDDGSGKVQASPELKALADRILNLTVAESFQLNELMKDHFGFDDSIGGMMMGGAGGGAGAGGGGGTGAAEEKEEVEERTLFDLKLMGFDSKSKIKVIKEVRAVSELGLKEAKELVEGAPKIVKKDIKMEDAENFKAKLEAVGATVEIV